MEILISRCRSWVWPDVSSCCQNPGWARSTERPSHHCIHPGNDTTTVPTALVHVNPVFNFVVQFLVHPVASVAGSY